MYVKVTRGDGHGDILYDAGDQIETGNATASIADLESDAVDFVDGMGAQCANLHVCELDPNQTVYEKNQGIFLYRWAWWYNHHGDRIGLVTTRNIFIVGDNGKTIDRVR